MPSPTARRAHDATHLLHVFSYFAPETDQRLVALGLDRGRMCYFASRAAPMGAVGSGVVTATFYNFSPALVGRCIPEAWQRADPPAVVAARLDAVDAALTRLLGADVLASTELTTLAGLVRTAAGACCADGRPLYAAHADLDWPDPPHLGLWHALTLLREHRGDGHIAALVTAGIGGTEAHVLHALFVDMPAERFDRVSHLPRAQLGAVVDAMRTRGLIGADGWLTAAGRQIKKRVETLTDELAAPAYDILERDELDQLIEHLEPLAAVLGSTGS